MSKATSIVKQLLEAEFDDLDLDPEEVLAGTQPQRAPRIAIRKIWSLWITPLQPEFHGYRDAEWPYPPADKPEWRKEKWIDREGQPVGKTKRQRNVDLDTVTLTWRYLNRRRAIPEDRETREPDLFRGYNNMVQRPYTGTHGKVVLTTNYYYLLDYSDEELQEIYRHLWDYRIEADRDGNYNSLYWNPLINPLPDL